MVSCLRISIQLLGLKCCSDIFGWLSIMGAGGGSLLSTAEGSLLSTAKGSLLSTAEGSLLSAAKGSSFCIAVCAVLDAAET